MFGLKMFSKSCSMKLGLIFKVNSHFHFFSLSFPPIPVIFM